MTAKKAKQSELIRVEATRHLEFLNEGERAWVEPDEYAGMIRAGYLKVVDEGGDAANPGAPGAEPGGTDADR